MMPTSVAICTSIFEAARPFAPAYILGIQDFVSALGSAPRIILANDGFADPQQLRRGLPAVSQVVDASGRGIGGVRHRMLEAAMAAECDVIVFCDFDDRLLPGAVGHLDALDDADISYGDLELIDTGGNVLAQSFFGGAGIPNEAKGPEVLLNRNFLGFSNTAVRRSALTPAVIDIPDALPTADWWFFSMMLEAGATARRCSGAVAQYRQHGANTLGGRPSPAPEA
ncbi:MAG: hypothetical protein FJ184_15405, partial [Gammaproteobacteria bacterium]|nr:hypothetical protein [Gammaproteobacteria bacterium]